MIVNRGLEERIFIWVALVVAAFGALPAAAIAEDAARGWEGSTPETQATTDDRKNSKPTPPDGQSETKSSSPQDGQKSSGWNDDSRGGAVDRRGSAEAAATASPVREPGNLLTAGDTALTAGQYADAMRSLDDAWRTAGPTINKQDLKTTALFFERRAIASRGLQKLPESERLIKQAIGHATTGGVKDPEIFGRLLFSLADIQNQEGLPQDSLTSIKQASAALSAPVTGAPSNTTSIMLVEAMNTEGRSLAETGDLQAAENKLREALTQCASLPAEAANIPPQSSVSKYSEYLKGKIKINQFYIAAIKGDASKARGLLDEGLAIIARYAPGMAPDTRYSEIILNAQKSNFSSEALQSALIDSGKLPGDDNLIKAALLQEQSLLKDKNNDEKGASEAVRAASDIRTKALPANSFYVAETTTQTASLQAGRGRANDAAALAQRAMSSLERSTGRNSLAFARAAVELASVYIASNRVEKLEPLLTETVNTFTKIRGANHPETMHAIDLLCSTYVRNKKYAYTIKYGEANLAAGEKLFGTSSPKIVLTLNNLGVAYSHLKKFAQSNGYLQRAQNILAKSGKSGTADYAELLASQGVNYTIQEKWGQAEAALKQARAIYSTKYGATSPHVAQMTELLKTLDSRKNPRSPNDINILQYKFQPKAPDYK